MLRAGAYPAAGSAGCCIPGRCTASAAHPVGRCGLLRWRPASRSGPDGAQLGVGGVVVDGPVIDVDRLAGDLLPGEDVHRPLAAGLAHRLGAGGVPHQLVELRRELGLEVLHVRGVVRLRRIVRHQQAGPAVLDDLRDAADGTGHHGRLGGHRLQIHDAQRLVDRRAGEHGGVRQHLAYARARQHLLHPGHPAAAGLLEVAEGLVELRGDLRGVRGAGEQQQLGARIELLRRPDQVHEPLLPGDPADEGHVRAGQVDAEPLDDVGVRVGGELFGVDAVEHHMDLLGVQLGVGLEDRRPHAVRHGDHRGGAVVGGALGPGRQVVAAAELFLLPRAVRLEGVGGDDVGDLAEDAAQVAGQVRVPGVRVHQVQPVRQRGDHRQIGAEDPQGGVGPGGVVLGVRGGTLPGRSHALDVDVDELAQLRDELLDVDARAPVDGRRILPGQDRNTQAHGRMLAQCWPGVLRG
ncbi:hypothetical protein SDC9_66305 [bioreactor metagenome]|uniref:Uncharacterized protein n=1 Tax=bioreactor metagenome TaxID=1076179 RepID=A0A644XVT1_9ZZZZ